VHIRLQLVVTLIVFETASSAVLMGVLVQEHTNKARQCRFTRAACLLCDRYGARLHPCVMAAKNKGVVLFGISTWLTSYLQEKPPVDA
jgi:hypothetical protein